VKIAVIFPGKIGDALFASFSVRHLSNKYPGAEIDWVYGTPGLTDFVTHCLSQTDLPVAHYIPHEYHDNYMDWKTMDWKSVLPGYDQYYNLTITAYPEPHMHLVEWIALGGGVIGRGEKLPNPTLNLSGAPRNLGQDKILVHPWIPPIERQWKWMMFLNPTYGGLQTYSIGHPTEEVAPKAVDLRGMPYIDYLDHLRSARVVVGVCSSSVAIAAALGTPTIMVHNITHPNNGGISRFGRHCVDLSKPFVYDIDRAINELLSV